LRKKGLWFFYSFISISQTANFVNTKILFYKKFIIDAACV
jgi:hypothetical protein